MRLLDQIAQSQEPVLIECGDGSVCRLDGAVDHAARIRECPLRYVLSDELTGVCAAIGYSDGHRLTECVDLLRVPSRELWVEWSDEIRQREYVRAGWSAPGAADPPGALRVGLLIRADDSGRRGLFNTFWTTREQPSQPLVAALETHFDFDDPEPVAGSTAELLRGKPVAIVSDDALDKIMQCVRYRFASSWADYYRRSIVTETDARRAVRESLASVANDLPMLLALLLLFASNAGLAPVASDLTRLNSKRARLGKPRLLEHLEVSLPVSFRHRTLSEGSMLRRGPRWHHVRGHLVRRAGAIFWRAPHWRGHMRLGRIKTRTVDLRASESLRRGENNRSPPTMPYDIVRTTAPAAETQRINGGSGRLRAVK